MKENQKRADNNMLDNEQKKKKINKKLDIEKQNRESIKKLANSFDSIDIELKKLVNIMQTSISGPKASSFLNECKKFNKSFKNKSKEIIDNEIEKVNSRIKELNNINDKLDEKSKEEKEKI